MGNDSDRERAGQIRPGLRNGPTRRQCLSGVVIAGLGVAGVLSTRATAQTKQKPTDVAYQDQPKDGQKCSGCALFQAPDMCQGVEGKISPEGWCSIFAPKA